MKWDERDNTPWHRCQAPLHPGTSEMGQCERNIGDSMYFCSAECQALWYRSLDLDTLT